MAVIYIREQGSVVRKRGSRLMVEKDGEALLEIPLRQTETVAVFGNIQVTTQALSELLERGIPLALYTRNGRLKGHLTPELSKNVMLRVSQYRVALDPAASLRIARSLVRAKLIDSAEMLDDYRAHYPSEELASACQSLRAAVSHASEAASNAELLGYEGSAAATYFAVFPGLIRADLPFPGRRKHPATDPVNALLSLGYTLAMNEIRALVEGCGLEPHLGFLHQLDYGRPSLALDLLEPFRASLVDRLTLRLINERILTASDFATRLSGSEPPDSTPGGVVLLPASLHRYLEAWEMAVTAQSRRVPEGIRAAWRVQVTNLTAALRDGTEFVPWCEEKTEADPCSI